MVVAVAVDDYDDEYIWWVSYDTDYGVENDGEYDYKYDDDDDDYVKDKMKVFTNRDSPFSVVAIHRARA